MADMDTLVWVAADMDTLVWVAAHNDYPPMVKICKHLTSIAPEKYLQGLLSSYLNINYL